MSKYKDRTTDFKDLKYFKEKNSISNILSSLKTDLEKGITSTENREEFFGSNKIFVEPVPHFCTFVFDSLQDLMVRILIVAAIVSIVLGCTVSDNPKKDWIDGVSIDPQEKDSRVKINQHHFLLVLIKRHLFSILGQSLLQQ